MRKCPMRDKKSIRAIKNTLGLNFSKIKLHISRQFRWIQYIEIAVFAELMKNKNFKIKQSNLSDAPITFRREILLTIIETINSSLTITSVRYDITASDQVHS